LIQAHRDREGLPVVGSDGEVNVTADHMVGPNLTGLSRHPYSQQNRATTFWVNFAPEHVDVDRPGDR
jgi:hypothetical protein